MHSNGKELIKTAINHEKLNKIAVLSSEVTSSDPADRSTKGPYFSLQVEDVDRVSQDMLRVPFCFRRVREVKESFLRVSVPSIVPANYVDIALEEKVEPISVRCQYHLLVNQGVRIAYDHSWLLHIIFLLPCIFQFDWLVLRARKEHTV